jgi:hypothetical protein
MRIPEPSDPDSLNPEQDLRILLYPDPGFSESRANPNPDLDAHQGFCQI